MKKFFYDRVYNYFSVNNLLSSSQFGFKSGASTEHALLKHSDDILKLFDQKKVAIATFIYLSKAFDCVDHNILLSKLKRYDIHETALQWINSYLSDREHFVSWNQTHSPLLNLKMSTPQGSILGPLLFLIYSNDIINSSNIMSFILFADHTTVYVQHDSVDGAIQILNSESAKVAEWFDFSKLTLNVNKTQMIMMPRKKNLNSQGDVILCNEAIRRVTKAKFLGVIVYQHLNYKDHIGIYPEWPHRQGDCLAS